MKRIIVMGLILVGSITFIAGCSKGKAPQAKEEATAGEQAMQQVNPGSVEVIDLGKGIKLDLVLIPAGKFKMGSPASEVGRQDNEKEHNETQHEVTLTTPFYIGKYEVTQEQWNEVMGNNPSEIKGAKLPVTNVLWRECQEFVKKLNEKTKGGYRLPTEAEWEYACRAGTKTRFSFGPKITPNDANYADSKIGKPVAVGSYKPNAFGLYDMHGNVREWCEDRSGDYISRPVTDPKGPNDEYDLISAANAWRMLRGGDFSTEASETRSSSRNSNTFSPTDTHIVAGFRLARTK